MRFSLVLIWTIFLCGCECDSLCEENRRTTKFLNDGHSNEEVIDYLSSYIGEAPGAERYSVFVNWGINHLDRFIGLMNHPNTNQRILDLVVYQISDMGQSEIYCEIYANINNTKNDKYIRRSIHGCKFSL